MGHVVPPGDVNAVADALVYMAQAGRPLPGSDVERARRDLNWDVVVQPLLKFCMNPRIAPDKLALREHVGSPHYIEHLKRAAAENKRIADERDHWKSTSNAYANGRLMRLLRWLQTGSSNLPS